MTAISQASLFKALENMLKKPVRDAAYEFKTLQGGTVGDVSMIEGTAATAAGDKTFRLVCKTQRHWERAGDPHSWRREYDIYDSSAYLDFPNEIKLPACYLLQEEENLTRIWMEALEGSTGNKKLHAPELAYVSEKLGAFQAKIHLAGRFDLPCVRPTPNVYATAEYNWGLIKDALPAGKGGFPADVQKALLDYAERMEEVLLSFDELPKTLCQGDVHHDNLFLTDEPEPAVYLIDWDTAGYGRMGEDAVDVLCEAFVYSSRDVDLMPGFRAAILDAYERGAKSAGVSLALTENRVRDIFALSWGFRIAGLFYYYSESKEKDRCIEILRTMLFQ